MRVFAIHLRNRPLANKGKIAKLAAAAAEALFADGRIVRDLSAMVGEDGVALRLRDFASGAMIAGIVEHASSAAMMRDVGGNGKASGIATDDLRWAVEQAQIALAHTNHAEAIKELIDQRSAHITPALPAPVHEGKIAMSNVQIQRGGNPVPVAPVFSDEAQIAASPGASRGTPSGREVHALPGRRHRHPEARRRGRDRRRVVLVVLECVWVQLPEPHGSR